MDTKILILIILTLFLLYFMKRLEKERFSNLKIKPIYAIQSVFILKENILFLEQWIDYHKQLGFNKFYLYDNSKVQRSGTFHMKNKKFKVGNTNKYSINYGDIVKLNDTELQQKLQLILNKYPEVEVIEWSPKDKNGIITFSQNQAFRLALQEMKKKNIKWCANIDMDEFIVINNGKKIYDYLNRLHKSISSIRLRQIRFSSRFDDVDKLVININKAELDNIDKHNAYKHIYRVNDTEWIKVHTWNGTGRLIFPRIKEIGFNHYKLNNLNKSKEVNNIDPKIKNKVLQNSKNYIKIQ